MKNVIEKVKSSSSRFAMIGAIMVMVFATVTIAYGMDNMVMGAHDVFHDYRHVMGMPCH